MKKVKVAVFDFDGTITKFDTTKLFTLLIILRFPIKSIMYIINFNHKSEFFSVGIIRNNLKGRSIKSISLIIKIYVFIVAIAMNKEILKEIEKISKLIEWEVIIATASPFFLVHPIIKNQKLIAHKYKIVDGVFTGETENLQPYGNEKLLQVEKYIECFGGNEISLAFSDSLADEPILNHAKKAFIVKGNRIIPYIKNKLNE